ncbi:hypothetical protein [Tenacibaculum halocynthiae]|uniref:hypothetical protein n=1 Tax=Tenacibaculum halocynthiae TaxID=1254437 RepID=UPI0038930B8E
MNTELNSILNKASIKLIENQKELIIKSVFKVSNKSNIGVLLIFLGGIFIIYVSIFKSTDWFSIILGGLLGGIMFIISLLTLIDQTSNYIKITKKEIKFKHKLKTQCFTLNSNIKIKMTQYREYTKSRTNTYYQNITLYLINSKSKIEIFSFLIEGKDGKEAKKLGRIIVQKLNNRITGLKKNIKIFTLIYQLLIYN